MSGACVFLETASGAVRPPSLAAVTAARALAAAMGGGPVAGVLIGGGLGEAAQHAARFVDRVLCADDPALASALAETWAPVLAEAVRRARASALIGAATSTGKDVLPRAAALLQAGMASDVVAILGPRTFRRPTHAGNALTDVEVLTPLVAASVRATDFGLAAPAPGPGAIESLPTGRVDTLGAAVAGTRASASTRPDLGMAKAVVSGGRGMQSSANFKGLEELADLLGGAVGASRAACDAGMAPNDLQVGQTGRVVAPRLYVAVAISGAIQHLAGMKGSKVIVAINKDPDAPIFQVADYGLVERWEKAVPELVAEIRRRQLRLT